MNLDQLRGEAVRRGLPAAAWLLVVDLRRQQLRLWAGGRAVRVYPVSTSRFGAGEQEGSFRTPTGWHEVSDRIGGTASPGQPFVSREPAGAPVPESGWREDGEGLILTRILRLRGLEPGRNAGPGIDTAERHVYLHGTNQEHRLGRPASRGCIHLANRDIIEVANLLGDAPAWCWIGELDADPPA